MNITSFWFKCPNCGSYEVKEKTFRTLMTPSIQQKMDRALPDSTISKFVAEWTDECPRCAKKISTLVKVSILREKK